MALIRQIAFRYFRGKRSANAVPILSRISMAAIAVSSAAMVIVFSVFNGMESLVKEGYNAFYPDLKISAVRGKFFAMDATKLSAVKQIKGVRNITTVIEDNVFADNDGQQKVVMLKGIDKNYFNVNDIRPFIMLGDDSVSEGHPYTAIGGRHILNELGADVSNVFSNIELFYPDPTVTNPEADPLSAFQSLKLHPAGAFSIEDDFDSRYVLAPLSLAQELFHQKGLYSSIEISADPGAADKVKEQLSQLLGAAWKIETRYEQNKTLYMVMGAERSAVRAILLLVLVIASFNMVGALSMLVLEKQKDISILQAMGTQSQTIRKIFLLEGTLWSLTGGGAGILVGCLVCFAQQHYGLVKLGGSFLVDAYPVKIELSDILLVLTIILIVGISASWYPSVRATKTIDLTLKSA